MEESDFDEWEKADALSEQEHAAELRDKLRIWYWLGGAAAVILLLCGLAFAFLSKDTSVMTSGDTVAQYVLEDGTKVWLDRNSAIDFSEFSHARRVLTLTGRAYFEVEHDSDHTFRIFAGGCKVVVVGTSFVVHAPDTGAYNTVSVIEGNVRLLGNDAGKGLVLRTGDKGFFNRASRKMSKEPGDIRNMLAWRDRKLVFNKTPMEDVVETLTEYFGYNIRIANPVLLRCRFTGSFQNPALKDVLAAVSSSLRLTIAPEADGYVIQGDGCKP
jgi:transmembrane sensor